MHVDDLPTNLKKAAENVDALVDLLIGVHVDLRAAVSRLEAEVPGTAGNLDLSPYTARQITEALMQLDDRRPALVRTWVNARLEAVRGRRSGRVGGTPSVRNGHAELEL